MTGAKPSWLGRNTLTPQISLPIIAVLIATVALLAILLILSDCRGAEPTCKVGTPGCELRQNVHWHADFALYIHGDQYDFNQKRFFSDEDHELSDNAHLHPPRHNVVHVHREGTTWSEFFSSLGFRLTDTCLTTPEGQQFCSSDSGELSFVLNGVRLDALAFQDITDIDRALISFGDESAQELMEQYKGVSNEACIVSLLCEKRLPPGGIEDEPCTGRSECN